MSAQEKDALGDRMKEYENTFRHKLPGGLATCLRLDGRSFHTFCRGFEKPFDEKFIEFMNKIGQVLCKEVMNVRMAYLQSDEISLVMMRPRPDSEDWFDGNIQKIVSIGSSIATAAAMKYNMTDRMVNFDARVFTLPSAMEVTNMLLWRERDWERNSIQMLARSMYSQKQLHGADIEKMHDMIHAKGKNWNDLPTHLRRGRCIVKAQRPATRVFKGEEIKYMRSEWSVDNEIPIFSKDREYILGRLVQE